LAAETTGESVGHAASQRTDPREMALPADRLRRQAGPLLRRAVSHRRAMGAADWTAARQPEVVPLDDTITWYKLPVPGCRVLRA